MNYKKSSIVNRQSSVKREVTVPGFQFSGLSAGIKKTSKKDLALIFSEKPAVIAGVFTTNKIKAAPVILDINRMSRSSQGQAIIINSGNANACTGQQGMKDAHAMAQITAKELGISSELIYVSSTGVIGKHLPSLKIKKAIPEAVKMLSPLSLEEAASSIMTTDTFPKIVSEKINISGKVGTIAGFAKGAGMICPSMATMLCFICTDIAIEFKALHHALREAARKSFNRLIIDNDMSTNDTALIMANGVLKNKIIRKNSTHYYKFVNTLNKITYNLSEMIAQDGEGATKLIEVVVKGAKTESDAEKVARAIAGSMLVKTAIYGKSLNWGRIMVAIGYSGTDIDEKKINISLNKVKMVKNGTGINIKTKPEKIFSGKRVTITMDLGLGRKKAKVLSCDLTEDYVKINADYMT